MFSSFAFSPDAIWVLAQKVWWFLIVIGVLISFHEFGHLLAARSVGVRVLKYSLGFGPKLFGRKIGETEYLISAVPLGGYVKLFGEEETDAANPEERSRSFHHKSVPRKMFIVAAGPGFNFLLAFLIFVGWLATGSQLLVPLFPDLTPIVKVVVPGSPAQLAGIQTNDKVLKVNDREITIHDEVFDEVQKSKGRSVTIDIQRGQTLKTFIILPAKTTIKIGDEKKAIYKVGIEEPPPVITSVQPNSPAMDAGFEPGDRVIRIAQNEIVTWADMTAIVSKNPESPLNFDVERDGKLVTLIAIPRTHERVTNGETKKRATIGISGSPFQILHADSFSEALIEGARATWIGTKLIGYTLYKLLSGELSRKALAGPLGIATISGQAAEKGVEAVIWLIALLSINLGVLNLLPIPILDGGHLFFFGLEGILRKPLGERQREIAQQIGLVLLICIFILALWNDIERLLSN